MQHIPGPAQLAAAKRIALRTHQPIAVVADIAARMEEMAARRGTISDLDHMERHWLGKGVAAVPGESFVCSGVRGVCWCDHSTWSIAAGADHRSGAAVPCYRAYRRACATGSPVRALDLHCPSSGQAPVAWLQGAGLSAAQTPIDITVSAGLPDITDLLEDDEAHDADPLDVIYTACLAIDPGKRVPIERLLARLDIDLGYLQVTRSRARQRYNDFVRQLADQSVEIIPGADAGDLYFRRVA